MATMQEVGVYTRSPVGTSAGTAPQPETGRNLALDAYRGFVMLLMMAEVLQLA